MKPGPTSQSLSRPSTAAGTSPRLLDAIAAQEGRFDQSVVAIDSGSTRRHPRRAPRAWSAHLERERQREFNHGDTRNDGASSRSTPNSRCSSSRTRCPTSSRWLEALVGPLVVDPIPGRNVGAPACLARTPAGSSQYLVVELDWRPRALPRTVGPISAAEFAALTPRRAPRGLRVRQRLFLHPDVGLARASRFRALASPKTSSGE